MMKRWFSCAAAALLAVLLLIGSALAAAAPGRYEALSCEKDEKQYRCEGEYIQLNEDGTGEVAFNTGNEMLVYSLVWAESDGTFLAQDDEGSQLLGEIGNGQLTVQYAGYDYVYKLGAVEEAAQASIPGYYSAVSCVKEGKSYVCQGEFIQLNADGTGSIGFNDTVYTLSWSALGGGDFAAADEEGRELRGAVSDGQLNVNYRGYDYVYVPGVPFDGSAEDVAPERWGSGLPYVFDQAAILTEDEVRQLTERAQEISQTYPCDVHIITLDDYTKYNNVSIERCAEEIRTGYDLGQGEDRDCIALILSMANRKYDIVIHGQYTHQIFPAGNRESIADKFLDNFKQDDWAGGFEDYLDRCESYLKGNGKLSIPIPAAAFGALIPSVLIGWIYCASQKRKMQAVAEQTRASSYVAKNGCQITYRADNYTGTTVSRVYSPRSSNSGGSSSSSGGGGHSHTSGSF